MYCTRCGKELEAGTKFCPNCGEPVRLENRNDYTNMEDYASSNGYTSPYYEEDRASVGLCIISFLFPFMGVIFFFMKRRTTPNKAKACLITGIVSFCIEFYCNLCIIIKHRNQNLLIPVFFFYEN